MPSTSRPGAWRLTRNRYCRALYDALHRVGITGAMMTEYEASAAETVAADAPEEVRFGTCSSLSRDVPERVADEHAAGDAVPCAVVDGALAGHCLLSDRPVRVPEIGAAVDPGGAYLWRLYVAPEHRGRGIGTALLEHARAVAAETMDCASVTALVAADNVPSRRAFEAAGYAPAGNVRYVRAFGLDRRWRMDSGGVRSGMEIRD